MNDRTMTEKQAICLLNKVMKESDLKDIDTLPLTKICEAMIRSHDKAWLTGYMAGHHEGKKRNQS